MSCSYPNIVVKPCSMKFDNILVLCSMSWHAKRNAGLWKGICCRITFTCASRSHPSMRCLLSLAFSKAKGDCHCSTVQGQTAQFQRWEFLGTRLCCFNCWLWARGSATLHPRARSGWSKRSILASRWHLQRGHPPLGRSHSSSHQLRWGCLTRTYWVTPKNKSETQQMFNYVLHIWGIKRDELRVAFICDSSVMVKSIAENGIGSAILPEIMIKKWT